MLGNIYQFYSHLGGKMKKFVSRKKSCYINFNNHTFLENSDTREILYKLLKKGYNHFYFSIEDVNSLFFENLIRLQNVYKNIYIYIVHNCKNPFWQQDKITNLPIWINEKFNEKIVIHNWLMRYCDICVQNLFQIECLD